MPSGRFANPQMRAGNVCSGKDDVLLINCLRNNSSRERCKTSADWSLPVVKDIMLWSYDSRNTVSQRDRYCRGLVGYFYTAGKHYPKN